MYTRGVPKSEEHPGFDRETQLNTFPCAADARVADVPIFSGHPVYYLRTESRVARVQRKNKHAFVPRHGIRARRSVKL